MTKKEIIGWLNEGDISTRYQVNRDLLGADIPILRKRIDKEGWGLKFLRCQNPDGHWGIKFYQPKWTSTHYTLLDLRNLDISPDNPAIKEILHLILTNLKAVDGGVGPIGDEEKSDVCVNGMALNYASYFKVREDHLKSVIDFLLKEQMKDGGFNCLFNRNGATHSSLHSSIPHWKE